ncbi:MAG: hypothetical protein K0S71_332 [Clostridia bacterium]|jgi:hypothetical protein|nr:hypothetical protein [Clostridia bacterium]
MINVNDVSQYITENILRSEAWDNADSATRIKTVNNADRLLKILLSDYYSSEVPTEDIANQALWMLKLDDMVERSEQGVSSLSVEGISVQLEDIERTIAPLILKSKGINPKDPRALIKRRVGSYGLTLLDTNRTGIRRGR